MNSIAKILDRIMTVARNEIGNNSVFITVRDQENNELTGEIDNTQQIDKQINTVESMEVDSGRSER